jgi:hypothetical protein
MEPQIRGGNRASVGEWLQKQSSKFSQLGNQYESASENGDESSPDFDASSGCRLFWRPAGRHLRGRSAFRNRLNRKGLETDFAPAEVLFAGVERAVRSGSAATRITGSLYIP